MTAFQPEEIDLSRIAEHVLAQFKGSKLEGYVVGRTKIRDVVAAQLCCSQAQAEDIVETMIGRGFLAFSREDGGSSPGLWQVARGS